MSVMSDVYSTELLRLAAEIPHARRLPAPHASARKVSRLCGSEIVVDLALAEGRIAEVGLEVSACALGQASASVFARAAEGATLAEVRDAREALHAMLKSAAAAPEGRFAALSALEGARGYPARHGSVMLAFDAALAAFEDALKREAQA